MTEPKLHTSLFSNLLILVFFSVLGAAIGWLHLSTQPPQWPVTARFEAPQAVELGNFYALKQTYQQLQNDDPLPPNAEHAISAEVFEEFKRQITPLDARLAFLSNNETVRQIAAVNYQPVGVVARQLAETLQFDPTTNTLSFQLINPEQAAAILNDFIQARVLTTREHLNGVLIQQWKALFQQVKQAAEANLGEQWQVKLNQMRSVQPLDDQLVPYHLVQKPIASAKPALPEQLTAFLAICAGIGALLGLCVIALRRK